MLQKIILTFIFLLSIMNVQAEPLKTHCVVVQEETGGSRDDGYGDLSKRLCPSVRYGKGGFLLERPIKLQLEIFSSYYKFNRKTNKRLFCIDYQCLTKN